VHTLDFRTWECLPAPGVKISFPQQGPSTCAAMWHRVRTGFPLEPYIMNTTTRIPTQLMTQENQQQGKHTTFLINNLNNLTKLTFLIIQHI
jgi:predicted LPLAT superfamily acyltransferase